MKIRRKRDGHTEEPTFRWNNGWKLNLEDGYRYFHPEDWEEVPEETWEEGDLRTGSIIDGRNLLLNDEVMIAPAGHRLRLDEGWVKVSDLTEGLRVRGWLTVDQKRALDQGCDYLQRPVLLVERRKEQ